ncbi:hypothetical protein L204_100230 [Cryptococcus depauperatus]
MIVEDNPTQNIFGEVQGNQNSKTHVSLVGSIKEQSSTTSEETTAPTEETYLLTPTSKQASLGSQRLSAETLSKTSTAPIQNRPKKCIIKLASVLSVAARKATLAYSYPHLISGRAENLKQPSHSSASIDESDKGNASVGIGALRNPESHQLYDKVTSLSEEQLSPAPPPTTFLHTSDADDTGLGQNLRSKRPLGKRPIANIGLSTSSKRPRIDSTSMLLSKRKTAMTQRCARKQAVTIIDLSWINSDNSDHEDTDEYKTCYNDSKVAEEVGVIADSRERDRSTKCLFDNVGLATNQSGKRQEMYSNNQVRHVNRKVEIEVLQPLQGSSEDVRRSLGSVNENLCFKARAARKRPKSPVNESTEDTGSDKGSSVCRIKKNHDETAQNYLVLRKANTATELILSTASAVDEGKGNHVRYTPEDKVLDNLLQVVRRERIPYQSQRTIRGISEYSAPDCSHLLHYPSSSVFSRKRSALQSKSRTRTTPTLKKSLKLFRISPVILRRNVRSGISHLAASMYPSEATSMKRHSQLGRTEILEMRNHIQKGKRTIDENWSHLGVLSKDLEAREKKIDSMRQNRVLVFLPDRFESPEVSDMLSDPPIKATVQVFSTSHANPILNFTAALKQQRFHPPPCSAIPSLLGSTVSSRQHINISMRLIFKNGRQDTFFSDQLPLTTNDGVFRSFKNSFRLTSPFGSSCKLYLSPAWIIDPPSAPLLPLARRMRPPDRHLFNLKYLLRYDGEVFSEKIVQNWRCGLCEEEAGYGQFKSQKELVVHILFHHGANYKLGELRAFEGASFKEHDVAIYQLILDCPCPERLILAPISAQKTKSTKHASDKIPNLASSHVSTLAPELTPTVMKDSKTKSQAVAGFTSQGVIFVKPSAEANHSFLSSNRNKLITKEHRVSSADNYTRIPSSSINDALTKPCCLGQDQEVLREESHAVINLNALTAQIPAINIAAQEEADVESDVKERMRTKSAFRPTMIDENTHPSSLIPSAHPNFVSVALDITAMESLTPRETPILSRNSTASSVMILCSPSIPPQSRFGGSTVSSTLSLSNHQDLWNRELFTPEEDIVPLPSTCSTLSRRNLATSSQGDSNGFLPSRSLKVDSNVLADENPIDVGNNVEDRAVLATVSLNKQPHPGPSLSPAHPKPHHHIQTRIYSSIQVSTTCIEDELKNGAKLQMNSKEGEATLTTVRPKSEPTNSPSSSSALSSNKVIDELHGLCDNLVQPNMGKRVNQWTKWSTSFEPGTLIDFMPELDKVWNGGKLRHVIKYQDSLVWIQRHLSPQQRFVACAWNRWVHQKGPIPVINTAGYLKLWLDLYGPILAQAQITSEVKDNLHIHFLNHLISLPDYIGACSYWNRLRSSSI